MFWNMSFSVRLESYCFSEDIVKQLTQDLPCPWQQVIRLSNPAPVRRTGDRRIRLQEDQGQHVYMKVNKAM